MIQLRALGVLDLRSGDNEAIRQVLAQPKRAALLTYLAVATPGGSHPRDKLLALFWPDQAPEQARNALSQAVHFLRRALGDDLIVSHDGDSLGVAPSLISCDAIAFEDAIRHARVEEALELYRGDFLEGFHVANAPEFERWLDAERQRLGEKFDAALETMATRCEQQGDHAAALNFRRRLAARAPYNSAIALRLMRSLAASGDQAAAVQYALVHEKLLRAELDMPLPTEITAFVAELHARPPLPPVVPRPVAEPIAGPIAGPIAETDIRRLEDEHSTEPVRPGQTRSRRVAILTAALVTVSVGVAYAVVWRETPDKLRLQELYRRGRNAEVNRSPIGIQTAMQYYRSAIERDSGFALAYAALSQSYGHLAHYDLGPKGASLDSARILAQRAVTLDSTLPETRTAMAMSLANSGHFAPAEREFRSAIKLGSNNPDAHARYGMLLISLGRGEEALAEAERALKLDPLGPRLALTVKTHATYLITGERPQRKLPTAERRPILKVEAGEPWARAHQALELAEEGRCADARSDISRAQILVPDSNRLMLSFVGMVDWSCGDLAHARALLAQMKRRPDAQDHALRVAVLHTRFGEKDSAFAWLDRHRWIISEYGIVRADPWLDSLRSDPRFPQLMRRLGIN